MTTVLKKTTLALLLVMLLFAASFAFAEDAGAVEAEPAENFTYTVNGEVNCTITGYTGNSAQLVIPAELDGYTVTAIGSRVFENNQTITSVVIPEGVTSIYSYAFQNCANLETVVLPDSLTEMSDAFRECTKLSSVNVPVNWTRSISAPFSGCTSLTSIVIPEGMTAVPANAFAGATNLSDITFPEGLVSIGESAFSNCDGITSLDLPDTVTTIGMSAFSNCDGITSLDLPDTVTTIGMSAFSGCDGITSLTLPDSVTTIGQGAFGCPNLKEFNYPLGWTTVETSYPQRSPFSGCTSLTSIVVPEGITSIPDYAFHSAPALSSITLPEGLLSIGNYAFQNCKKLTGIDLPDSLQSIGASAFDSCSLESITTGASLTSIGNSAFSTNTMLTSADLSASIGLTALPAYCFSHSALTDIKYPPSLTTFGGYCFSYSTFTSFTIPDIVTTIAGNAFQNCKNLETVVLSKNWSACPSPGNLVTTSPFTGCTKLKNIVFPDGFTFIPRDAFTKLVLDAPIELVLPDSLETIDTYAFSECKAFSSIKGGKGLKNIGNYAFTTNANLQTVDLSACTQLTAISRSAFTKCTALTEVKFPSSLTSIGESVFLGCSALANVQFPNGLTTIDMNAFNNCDGLTSLAFPDSVTTIGPNAFYGCDGLTQLAYPTGWTTVGGSNSPFRYCSSLTSIVIPEGITAIPDYAFYEATSLTSITLPEGLLSIGNYAFYKGCFTSIDLPDSLQSIGSSAFNNTSLESITTGASLTSIGTYAFRNNKNLTEMDLSASTGLTVLPSYCFEGCTALASIQFPPFLTTLNDYCFSKCSFTSFTVPDSVTAINMPFVDCPNLDTIVLSKNWTSGNAVYGCTKLKNLVLPEGLTFIPRNAFAKVTLDTPMELVLPDSLETIDTYAFTECKAFSSIKGGKGLKNIGTYAFNKNANLQKVDLSACTQLTDISSYAFYICTALKEVKLPETLTTIGQCAFYSCASLSDIHLPDSITTMLNSAFYECTSLKTVNYPKNWNKAYMNGAGSPFRKSGLASIVIPEGVTAIPAYAFYGANDLENVTLPKSLLSIGNNAFSNTAVTEIELPDGFTTLGNDVFSGCLNLQKITLPDSLTNLGSSAFSSCKAMESIVIPDGVTSIGYGLFNGCTSLKNVTLSKKLVTVADNTFYGCTALESIVIPDSVSTIGISSFSGCTALSNVTLSSNLRSINASAFSNCTSLESIYLPDSITSMGQRVFNGCTSLSSVNYPKNWETVPTNSGYVDNFHSPFSGCPLITEITVPEGVTKIPSTAFSHVTSLEKIHLPDSVTVIGTGAFLDTGLSELVLPASLVRIDSSAFYTCSALKRVVFPETLTTIRSLAFAYCPELEALYFPQTNPSIENTPIQKTDNLTIYCYDKTTAHNYAINNEIPFVLLDDHEHDYELLSQSQPTCTGSGRKTYRCTLCGYSYRETIPAAGHKWGEWEVLKEATVMESGLRQRVCSVCRQVQKEVIQQLELTDDLKDFYGYTTFTVVNANNASPIYGAELIIRLDEESELTIRTGTDGKVTQLLPVGSHKVYVYYPGMMGRNVTITVVSGENTVPVIGLSDSDFVDAEFTVEEMTEQEIIDAGIDTSDPANQHIYRYEVDLDFLPEMDTLSLVYYLNEDGEIVNPPDGVYPNITPDGSGSWRPHGNGGSLPGFSYEDEDGNAISVYPVSEDFYLIVHGEVRWVKEMFDVELLVLNKSLTDTLENTKATLTLPEGLSLAAMNGQQQSAQVNLGTIAEGGKKSAHWYVRGDAEGTYDLSATLTGTLMPFEEDISREYQAADVIKVYAGSAMQLTYYAPDAVYYGSDCTVKAVLENVSDRELYGVGSVITNARAGKYTHYSDGFVLETVYLDKDEALSSAFAQTFKPGDTIEMEISVPIDYQSPIIAQQVEAVVQTVQALDELDKALEVFTDPNSADSYNSYLARLNATKAAGLLPDDVGERLQTILDGAALAESLTDESLAELEHAVELIRENVMLLPIRYNLVAAQAGLLSGTSEIPTSVVCVPQERTQWMGTPERYVHAVISAIGDKLSEDSLNAVLDALSYSAESETVKAVEGEKQIVVVHTAEADANVGVWAETYEMVFRPVVVKGEIVNGGYEFTGSNYIEVTPGDDDDTLHVSTIGMDKAIHFDTAPAHTCEGEWQIITYATDDTAGFEVQTCAECGRTMDVRRTRSACEWHEFSEYQVDVEPAEGRFGIETRVCSQCHALDYRLIDHNGAGEYTVDFDANGGQGPMSIIYAHRYGESFVLPECSFYHYGKQFVCWGTSPDGLGDNYAPNEVIMPTSSITLYAQWGEDGLMDYDLSNVRLSETFFPYDGEEHEVYIEGLPEGVSIVSIQGSKGCDVGEYIVTAELAAGDAFHHAPVLPELKWVISSALGWEGDLIKVYDGTSDLPFAFTALGDADISIAYFSVLGDALTALDAAPSNVGAYRAVATSAVGEYTETLAVDYEIIPREATVAPDDVSRVYDGHEAIVEEASAHGLVQGHRLVSIRLVGTQVLPGSYELERYTIAALRVEDEAGNDVTDNYTFTCETGVLTILKRTAVVIPEDVTAVYDGMPHTAQAYEGSNLLEGHSIVDVIFPDGPTDAGETLVGLMPEGGRVVDENGDDLMHLYELEYRPYSVTITKRPVTIAYEDYEREYNGYSGGYPSVTIENLVEGHELTHWLNAPSVSMPGTYEDHFVPTNIAVLGWGGEDVSANYDVTAVAGDLIIHPRKLTITVGDMTAAYDGTPQGMPHGSVEYTADRLVAAHHVDSVAINGEAILPGEYPGLLVASDAVIHTANGRDVTSYYDITYVPGTLIITGEVEEHEPIALSAREIHLRVGESVQLIASGDASWRVSDDSILHVTDEGVITRLQAGSAQVIAADADGCETICSVLDDNLTRLQLPAAVRIIQTEAYEGDTSLQCVDLTAAQAPEIQARAFADCDALRKVLLPEGVSVDSDAFEGSEKAVIYLLDADDASGIGNAGISYVICVQR